VIKIRVIPVLLVEYGRLVKTRQFKNPVYLGDPINTVNIFNQKEVDELIFLDISRSRKGEGPNYQLIKSLAKECFMPFAYGGGVTTIEEMYRLFNLGVEKVVVNTLLLKKPEIVAEAVNVFGAQSIVASVDIGQNFFNKTRVYSHVKKRYLTGGLNKYLHLISEIGVGELMVTSVSNDGEMSGYDVSLLKEISSRFDIPLIGCGGAGSVNDIVRLAKESTVSAAAAGSFFVFYGKHRAVLITYPNYQRLEILLSD